MEIEFNWGTLVVLCFSGILCFLLHYLYGFLWLKPERMREKLRKQGMRGPPPSLLLGNIIEMKRIQMEEKGLIGSSANVMVDYSVALFPYFKKWRNEFGIYLLVFMCFSDLIVFFFLFFFLFQLV